MQLQLFINTQSIAGNLRTTMTLLHIHMHLIYT